MGGALQWGLWKWVLAGLSRTIDSASCSLCLSSACTTKMATASRVLSMSATHVPNSSAIREATNETASSARRLQEPMPAEVAATGRLPSSRQHRQSAGGGRRRSTAPASRGE